jgi:hypothetical protein
MNIKQFLTWLSHITLKWSISALNEVCSCWSHSDAGRRVTPWCWLHPDVGRIPGSGRTLMLVTPWCWSHPDICHAPVPYAGHALVLVASLCSPIWWLAPSPGFVLLLAPLGCRRSCIAALIVLMAPPCCWPNPVAKIIWFLDPFWCCRHPSHMDISVGFLGTK